MPNYTAAANTASRMIKNAGLSLTFTRTDTAGGYDPSTGGVTAVESTYNAYGVWLLFRAPGVSEAADSLIQIGDAKVLLDPLGTEPKIGDTVVNGGETWRVVNVTPLSPGGTDVLYTLQARR